MAGKELFSLIKSMSQTERRFFTLQAGDKRGKLNYLRLFDAIDSLEEYDEKKLAARLKGDRLLKNLHVEKQFLFENLLKTLRAYHKDASPEMVARNMLADIEILFGRGLLNSCEKKIQACLRFCEKHELPEIKLIALESQKRVLSLTIGTRDYESEDAAVLKQKKDAVAQISEIISYQEIEHYIFSLKLKTGRPRKENADPGNFADHPLINRSDLPRTKFARLIFHGSRGFYYEFIGDYEKTFETRLKQVALLESEFEIPRMLNSYIYALSNLAIISTSLQKYDVAIEALLKLKNIPVNYPALASDTLFARTLIRIHIYGIRICLVCGCFSIQEKVVGNIREALDAYGSKMETVRQLQLYLFVAVYCTFSGKPNLALPWVNKILNNLAPDVPREGYCITYILNLIIHYELGNFTTLDSLVKSTYRFLAKSGRLYKVETTVLKFLSRTLSKNFDTAHLKIMFEDLYAQLSEITKSPLEAKFLEDLDLLSWVESKISNKALPDIVREKGKGYGVDEGKMIALFE
jgi:tetratricopeptide (TPR) repeat protein